MAKKKKTVNRKRKAGIVRWMVLDVCLGEDDKPVEYVNIYRNKPEPHNAGGWTSDSTPCIACARDVRQSLTRGRLPREGECRRYRFTTAPEGGG